MVFLTTQDWLFRASKIGNFLIFLFKKANIMTPSNLVNWATIELGTLTRGGDMKGIGLFNYRVLAPPIVLARAF